MNAPAFDLPTVRTARLADPVERASIGGFLASRPEALPFHLPEWSEAVERGCGQRAHYLVVARADGRIRGVLPLTQIRSLAFGSALVSAGFGVGGGILAADERSAAGLAQAGWDLARDLACPRLELRGGPLPPPFIRCEGTYAGFVRDLPETEEAILNAIPRKQRAEVRRALGLALDIEIASDRRAREAHYAVYAESVRNLGTPVFPRRLFEAMLDAFGDAADIVTIREGDRPVASVLSFYQGGTVYPYWGGGTREARRLRANELLYFALMRHGAERGCRRFDFGRSKLGTGAFAYKKHWGFEPQPIVYGVRTAEGAAPRTTNPLSPKYRLQVALWRRLPLFVANRLGPPIARGLG